MSPLDERLKGFVAEADTIPLPGSGLTPHRHRALLKWGCEDLSFARIAEAHTDALAILTESGHAPRPQALYGVWASDAPPSRVTCAREGDTWRIQGVKQFCSGTSLVDAALVTAHHAGSILVFDVPIRQMSVTVEPSRWASPAFADTCTATVRFDATPIPDSDRLGDAGWYLTRPGFWHGSIGPAACWAGGAQFLIDAAATAQRRDAHSRAHVGAMLANAWALQAILEQAGREIDADPQDKRVMARIRGLTARHLIERICADTLDRFGRATGPHLLAYDEHVVRQHVSLSLYIRQCHGARDLESIPAAASSP